MNINEIKKIARSIAHNRQFRKVTSSFNCGFTSIDYIREYYNINARIIDFKTIEGEDWKDCEAATYYNEKTKQFNICIQSGLIQARKRYALAVQLGHIFLKHISIDDKEALSLFKKETMYNENKVNNIKLKEAIIFAKELLMPEEYFLDEANRGICTFIDTLADTFLVSKVAARNRCLELNITKFYE